jgi:hypothetical protein
MSMGRFCLLFEPPLQSIEGNMKVKADDAFDIDALLHPASAYRHPRDVVGDDDLTLYEKRAILSSQASDACAVKDFPELRELSGLPVKFDDIIDSLCELDDQLERRVHSGGKPSRPKDPGSDHSGNIPIL